MVFREIVAPTVKELFVQQLEGMILSGELRPGDRLPACPRSGSWRTR